MVGEMRDRETSEIAVQAALTGHLVFSTLHTTGAARTVDRGFTADDYRNEIPRLFGAAARRADPPPPGWTRDR